MRFMMMVMVDEKLETGAAPDPRLDAAIGKHAEEMTKAGVLLEMGGLLPTSMGARIRAAGGKLTVKDGPFTEAKEFIGGFAILKTKSKAEAIELGQQFMKMHTDILGPSYQGVLEIRQMFDPADFASEHCKP